MNKGPKIENDFNELEFLFDSNWEDVFGEITKRRFGTNLLFAIIETTTIGKLSSVGTTQYIAFKSDEYIKNVIHKDYFSIIKEIKQTAFGSPSQYYDWYKREKFYYAIGENVNATTEFTILPNTVIREPEPKPDSNNYIKEYDKKLTDTEIRDFFQRYTNSLLSKKWFKELPHYFILVKPISIKDKETDLFIPLGNLYLKIGTWRKVKLDEYKKYVLHLKAVWFNKFGAKILKEYSEKKTSDEYKPKYSLHPNLEKKFTSQLFKYNTVAITLNDFYYYAFDLDANQSIKNEYLTYSHSPLINKIIAVHDDKNKITELIKEAYDSKSDPKNILTKNIKGLKGLNQIDDNAIKYFLLLLSKRRLALLLLFVLNFSEAETHNCVTFGEKESSTTPDSIEIYLRENLFIYPGSGFNLPLLADREMLFLRRIIVLIKSINPKFTCSISD